MNGFLGLFSKKNIEEGTGREPSSPLSAGYFAIDTSNLKKLPAKELYKLVYNYSNEVTELNKQVEAKDKIIEMLQGQIGKVSGNKKFDDSFIGRLKSQIKEYKKDLKECNNTIEALSDCLKEKDSIIKSYRRQMSLLNFQLSGNNKTEETDIEYDLTALSLKIEGIIKENSKLYFKFKEEQEKNINFYIEKESHKLEIERLKLQIDSFDNMISSLNEAVKHKDKSLAEAKEKLSRKNEELQNTIASPSLATENQALKAQLKSQSVTNKQLARQLFSFEAKSGKTSGSATERMPIVQPAAQTSPLFKIQVSLSHLYKTIMQEFNKSSDGNISVYSLESPSFTNIERTLNDLISLVDENIQLSISHSKTPSAKNNEKTMKRITRASSNILKKFWVKEPLTTE